MKRLLLTTAATFIFASFAALPVAAAPKAGNSSSIAAVVAEEAISQYDVDKRLRFVIATTSLANTPDVINRVRPQVLRALINEKLQLQEAKAHKIEVGDDEVNKAIAGIEQERGMPPGAIFAMMEDKKVPKDTFTEQVRAQLAWGKLIAKVVRPRLKLSEEEIAVAQRNYIAPIKIQEMQIGIMLLPVFKPSQDAQVRGFAEKVVSESRRGASFEELGRQFAGGSGRVDKFWVRPENMEPTLAKALSNAREGSIAGPMRNQEGYALIKVYAVRAAEDDSEATKAASATVKVKEFLFKLKPDATMREAESMLVVSQELAKTPGKCDDSPLLLADLETETNILQGTLAEMPPAVRAIVEPMRVGAMSEPFASKEGIRTYMLCERGTPKTELAPRDKVYPVLMQQRVEKEAQKYMRNLTRTTFIDVRDSSEQAPAKADKPKK